MFCSNCGTQIGTGVNFCPNCGAKVMSVVTPAATAAADNMVMLVSLGACSRTTAAALLQQICGYTADEALLIVDSAPITVARGLTDAQARYLAQALAEYGVEVSVYDGNGWRELESASTSVWDQTGALLAGVASALGLMSVNNRITRDMMRRADYPYRYSGTRPPVYRLHNTLRAVPPRHVAPTSVRPPVHRAPAPRPAPAPHPAPPPRPAPQPARPAPAPRPAPQPAARPTPAPRPAAQPARPTPAPRPAAQPARPTPAPRPAAQPQRPSGPAPRPGNGTPGGRPGGGNPGGRPGGGAGRRG